MIFENAMTPDQLAQIGQTLFGPHWITPLAAELPITRRHLQRYASGKNAIAAWVPAALLEVVVAHRLGMAAQIRHRKPLARAETAPALARLAERLGDLMDAEADLRTLIVE